MTWFMSFLDWTEWPKTKKASKILKFSLPLPSSPQFRIPFFSLGGAILLEQFPFSLWYFSNSLFRIRVSEVPVCGDIFVSGHGLQEVSVLIHSFWTSLSPKFLPSLSRKPSSWAHGQRPGQEPVGGAQGSGSRNGTRISLPGLLCASRFFAGLLATLPHFFPPISFTSDSVFW